MMEKMEVIRRAIISVLCVFKTIEKDMKTKKKELENIHKIQKELSEFKNTVSQVESKG